jgi:hypothetical protein
VAEGVRGDVVPGRGDGDLHLLLLNAHRRKLGYAGRPIMIDWQQKGDSVAGFANCTYHSACLERTNYAS